MSEQAGQWHFLTNHARVLFAIARGPAARLRDIAAVCRITERTAQSIVTDLEQAGYIRRERDGRRTRYILCADGTNAVRVGGAAAEVPSSAGGEAFGD